MGCFSINEAPVMTDVIAAVTPVITALEPDTCVIGDPDFTLYVVGVNFSDKSEIIFAGQPEPTTLSEDKTQVSTGVKPSLWLSPVTVQCQVCNGPVMSNAMDFTFAAAAPEADATRKGKQSWQRQSSR